MIVLKVLFNALTGSMSWNGIKLKEYYRRVYMQGRTWEEKEHCSLDKSNYGKLMKEQDLACYQTKSSHNKHNFTTLQNS